MLKRRLALGLVAVLLGGALVAAGGAAWVSRELGRPFAGWSGEHVDVVLEPGMSAAAMLDRLAGAGVLRHPSMVRAWLSWTGGGADLRAGEYRFERAASPLRVLERLRAGDVLLYQVTLPEGLTLGDVARRFAEAGFGTVESLEAAFRDPSPIRSLDPQARDLEGYLFPDTYRFPRGTSPERIARVLVQRFRAVVGDDYAERSAAVGLELQEAVSLASLIEKETSVPEERRRISRVFHNRLARGMRLQCDPTVLYALHRAGHEVGRLSRRDLEFDSPWNTYRVAGLPPGPIANPGRASLEAAVLPDEGDELYFVAAPGGGHRFSTNLRAHERAVAEWRSYLRSSR